MILSLISSVLAICDGCCNSEIKCQGEDGCCSEYGYCGRTEAYCGKGCQTDFGSFCWDNTTLPTCSLWSGKSATLTVFDDPQVQCFNEIPNGLGFAINPKILGISENEWDNKYSHADPATIPWCGKGISVTLNGQTVYGTIIDTCDPTGNDAPKCNYDNVIDLYGQEGKDWLYNLVGDDFYQGDVSWFIF